MNLSTIKQHLATANAVNFRLPDGSYVPQHFHITEVGMITKDFIDCGGTVRHEKVVNFQLWEAGDFDHRVAPEKLSKIIALSEKALGIEDLEIEVEYQSGTIGKYGLDFDGKDFQLTVKNTACLVSDSCRSSGQKQKISLASLGSDQNTCCNPGSGCC